MNNYFNLVGFEYKKIFRRKSTFVCLVALFATMVLLAVITVTGSDFKLSQHGMTRLEAIKMYRDTIRINEGAMDEALVNMAISQNAVMIADDDNYLINQYGRFLKDDAYIKYSLPYESVINTINIVYETNLENLSTDGFQVFNLSMVKPIDTLTTLSENDFYGQIHEAAVNKLYRLSALSDNEINKHLSMLSQVKTPYRNDYYTGYYNFIVHLETLAFVLLIFIAICVSPIFSNEYQSKADSVILATKYGKNKVIFAKLFAGASLGLSLAIVLPFVFMLILLTLNGFEGFDVPIQLMDVYSTYPVTMLQAALTAITVTVFATVFFTMLVMLLSSMSKTPFAAVIFSFLILFIPIFINISPKDRLIYQFFQLLPANATRFLNIFSEYFFEIWEIVFTPAVFYVIFVSAASLVMIPFTYRIFRNHQ